MKHARIYIPNDGSWMLDWMIKYKKLKPLDSVHVFSEDELKERDKKIIRNYIETTMKGGQVNKDRIIENTKANDDITYGLHK